ncbi:MAG: NAD(+)/NADH kinase [Planctomycetota bacterium]
MDRVLVAAHSAKGDATRSLGVLESWLTERGLEVQTEPDLWEYAARREQAVIRGEQEAPFDLAIVLGGDGAILSAVRAFRDAPVPVLGINFGRVGFLAAVPASRWEETVQSVLDGQALVEPRMRVLLRYRTVAGELWAVALNDVVVSRAPEDPMLQIGLDINEDWVTDYRADGLILATPSGSTAYSLSAGGPILAPSMLGIVVTPICSQALANRPLVLDPESKLRVRLSNAEHRADIVVDGQRFGVLAPGEELLIERHPVSYPLISMPDLDPWRRLRSRLGWSGDVRPDR